MATEVDIDALDREALPHLLHQAGLLPGWVLSYVECQTTTTGLSKKGGPKIVYILARDDRDFEWNPQGLIDDCWYLVEHCGLTIQPSSSPERGQWWVGVPTEYGTFAQSWDDVPMAICRAALIRKAREARP